MSQSDSVESASSLLLGIYRPDRPDDEIYLSDGLTIGRSGANDIQLEANSPEIASRHAHTVADDRGGYLLICDYPGSTVTPLGSRNEDLDPVSQLRLRVGTRFRIGQTLIACLVSQKPASVPELRPRPDRAACPRCNAELTAPPLGGHLCPSCASVLFTYLADKAGQSTQTIPGDYSEYRIDTFIASGALGPVFHALRRDGAASGSAGSGPREAVIKILRNLADPAHHEPFREEIRTIERLMSLGCPYIVRLLGSGKVQRNRFLILEWVDGLGLDEYLRIAERRRERIQLVLVLRWLEELARGLDAIHEAGHYHLAISPSKILLDKTRHLRIVDFGLSNLTFGLGPSFGAGASGSSTMLAGDSTYRAPEQLSGSQPIGPKTDQFALGLIAHELITGTKMPALGRVDDSGLRRRKLTDSMALRIRSTLLRLLAEDPNQRFSSCMEVAEAFRELSKVRAEQRSTPAPAREQPVAPQASPLTARSPSVEAPQLFPSPLGATRARASTRAATQARDEPVDFEPIVPELDVEPVVNAPRQERSSKNHIPLMLCASLAILFFSIAAWHWMGRHSDGTSFLREREESQKNLEDAHSELQTERERRQKAEGRIQELDVKIKSSSELRDTINGLNKKLEAEQAKTKRLREAVDRLEKQLKAGPLPASPDHTSSPAAQPPIRIEAVAIQKAVSRKFLKLALGASRWLAENRRFHSVRSGDQKSRSGLAKTGVSMVYCLMLAGITPGRHCGDKRGRDVSEST
ncbi:MAG TPA: protein kinase [Planctomycetaceae bacterium]|jgi:serine/threonine-protein kinase|nr:protein kinase [Planctomycetaceae bacterium]